MCTIESDYISLTVHQEYIYESLPGSSRIPSRVEELPSECLTRELYSDNSEKSVRPVAEG